MMMVHTEVISAGGDAQNGTEQGDTQWRRLQELGPIGGAPHGHPRLFVGVFSATKCCDRFAVLSEALGGAHGGRHGRSSVWTGGTQSDESYIPSTTSQLIGVTRRECAIRMFVGEDSEHQFNTGAGDSEMVI